MGLSDELREMIVQSKTRDASKYRKPNHFDNMVSQLYLALALSRIADALEKK